LIVDNSIRSITIGSFDGIHLAHLKLIDQADLVVVIERGCGYLTAGYRRSLYIKKPCAFYLFESIKLLSPQEFVDRLKSDFPSLEKIVVGYDFRFGSQKAGDANTLRALFDGRVIIVDEVTIDSVSVHSRTIKRYLKDGDIYMANRLLDRRYTIDGRVVSGQGLGNKELVATLNLIIDRYQLPKEGVYATLTLISDEWLPSVSFLGHRATTDGSFAVETHILDRDIGIVDGIVSISFVEYLRPNRRFDTIDDLRKAIYDDIKIAKEVLT